MTVESGKFEQEPLRLDLSKIPYEVDTQSDSRLIEFIARLDLQTKTKMCLVRYAAESRSPGFSGPGIRSIRDLYEIADRADVYIWNIGNLRAARISENLAAVARTGVFPTDLTGEQLDKVTDGLRRTYRSRLTEPPGE